MSPDGCSIVFHSVQCKLYSFGGVIGDILWVEQVASSMASHMLYMCPTSFERFHLLRLFSEEHFGDEFKCNGKWAGSWFYIHRRSCKYCPCHLSMCSASSFLPCMCYHSYMLSCTCTHACTHVMWWLEECLLSYSPHNAFI